MPIWSFSPHHSRRGWDSSSWSAPFITSRLLWPYLGCLWPSLAGSGKGRCRFPPGIRQVFRWVSPWPQRASLPRVPGAGAGFLAEPRRDSAVYPTLVVLGLRAFWLSAAVRGYFQTAVHVFSAFLMVVDQVVRGSHCVLRNGCCLTGSLMRSRAPL